MIIERVREKVAAQIKQFPVHSNRASEIGHPCEKYLVLMRTRWQEKTLHDVNLQFIFNEGGLHEESVIRAIQNAGIQVIEQQRAFQWEKYQITGHVDGKVLISEKALPLEIKSMSPFTYDSINSVQDLLNGRYYYLKKYPAQLTLYMLMDEKDEAIFIFKNKVTGQLKEILMTLDYEYGEGLLKKVERINNHVLNNTLPDPIEWDEYACGGCGFAHICLPEVKRTAIDFSDNKELEDKLKRRDELKISVSEYDRIDREIKETLKEKEKVVIGDYLVIGRWIEKNMPAKEAYIQKYWQTKINNISKGGNHE